MEKPAPAVTPESAPFWEGCAVGELRYQLCTGCGRAQFPPAAFCRTCGGLPEWRTSLGRGTVFSVTQVHRAPVESFRGESPYVLALIDLDEGFRMMMNIVGADRHEAAIRRPVSIVFEPRAGLSLPQARLERV